MPGLDPSLEYFSIGHAPFAIFAILILIGPVLLPVIFLALYPVRAFRSLLEKCKVSGHSRAAVNLFVEKFYSCYRDGLDGGKDMRSFVFLPFFLRLSIFFGLLLGSAVSYWLFRFVLFGGASLLIALVQPYKQTYMNVIDAVMLAMLSLLGILYIVYLNLNLNKSQSFTFIIVALCSMFTLPILGFVIGVIVKVLNENFPSSWSNVYEKLFLKRQTVSNESMSIERQESHDSAVTTDIEFPDRVLHPYSYVNDTY